MVRLFFIYGFVTLLALPGCGDGSTSSDGESTLTTWAGEGTQGFDGDGLSRTESWLNQPMELLFDGNGIAYVADWNNHRIRTVGTNDLCDTMIGTVLPGDWPCQDPSDASDCDVALTETVNGSDLSLNHPMDLALASDGSITIAAWHNHKVLSLNPATGEVSVIAGGQSPGFSGDGGPANEAKLNFPDSLVFDAAGNLFVADERNNRVRRIANDASRTIQTVAGSSSPPSQSAFSGDGGPATSAKLALTAYDELGGSDNPPPGGPLALDSSGDLYVSDTANHCVRKIMSGSDGIIGGGESSEEIITTVVGQCTVSGYSGDGGSPSEATLQSPHDIEFGPDGRLYVADSGNHVIRAVDFSAGLIQTVVGSSVAGFSGDEGSPLEARLREPYGIAFDADGRLYVVDTLNNRIRVVEE